MIMGNVFTWNICISAPTLYLFVFLYDAFRLLPESPRWLLVKKKQSQALSLIKQIAKANRQQYVREEGFGIILETEEKVKLFYLGVYFVA